MYSPVLDRFFPFMPCFFHRTTWSIILAFSPMGEAYCSFWESRQFTLFTAHYFSYVSPSCIPTPMVLRLCFCGGHHQSRSHRSTSRQILKISRGGSTIHQTLSSIFVTLQWGSPDLATVLWILPRPTCSDLYAKIFCV